MHELDIGEVSRQSGLTASALRFYEQKGLIRSIGRAGLRRQFHPSVLERLALIRLGQAAGLSLEEIHCMFDDHGTLAINRELLLNKAELIARTIQRLQQIEHNLRHVVHCPHQQHLQCHSFQKLLHPDETPGNPQAKAR